MVKSHFYSLNFHSWGKAQFLINFLGMLRFRDDQDPIPPHTLAIVEEAQKSAMKTMKEMNEAHARIVESMRPTLDIINNIVTGSGFQTMLDSVASVQKATEAMMKHLDTSAWTRMFNAIDVRPIIAETLAPSFPAYVDDLDWDEDVNEEEAPSPLREATEEVVSLIEDKVTQANEGTVQRTYLVLKPDRMLYDRDTGLTQRLSLKLYRLVARLQNDYTSTRILRGYSGYGSDESTRRAIQKLNRYSFGPLQLKVKIAIGEKDQGYRLATCIRLRVEPQKIRETF